MQVQLSGQDAAHVESINVSANGVYFSTRSHIPPLTKVGITLVLPVDEQTKPREVAVEGVVVRTDPEQPVAGDELYEVACYFTSISERDREYLESYILKQLAF